MSNGMYFTAALLAVGAAALIVLSVVYRLKHFHEYAQLAPDWVTLFPLIGSCASLVALLLHWTATRLRKRERKRLETLYGAAGLTAMFNDLPGWMKWVKPDRSRPFATATRALTSALLVAAVTTSAGMVLAAPPSVLLKATGGQLVGQLAQTTATVAQASPSATTGLTNPGATPQLSEIPLPTNGEQLSDFTLGPDSMPWYTTQDEDILGHLSANGKPTEIPLSSTVKFKYLTTGPDGNLWCTGLDNYGQETPTPAIFKVTPDGAITTYHLPVDTQQFAQYYPQQITVGPDGALWFVYQLTLGKSEIGRITTTGSTQFYPLPATPSGQTDPIINGITAGPDGNVWFTEYNFFGDDKIARITPSGNVKEFPLPITGNRPQGDKVGGIVTGPDHNLWFVEMNTGKIGRITPNTPTGDIQEFDLPTTESFSFYTTGTLITSANGNGSLWVALAGGDLGHVTTTGVITVYSLSPQSNSSFAGIVASPDGTLWIAETGGSNRGQIGKVTQ